MALVAYGSSDISSDEEDVQMQPQQHTTRELCKQSIETCNPTSNAITQLDTSESHVTSSSSSTQWTSHPSDASRMSNVSRSHLNRDTSVTSTRNESLAFSMSQPKPKSHTPNQGFFSALPPPKSNESMGCAQQFDFDDDVSDVPRAPVCSIKTSKEKSATEVTETKTLLRLPVSSANSDKKDKKRQPVKISAPALVTNDDSDEDESSKEKKKPAVVGGGTGLFALLPQPKHAVTKETNRLLLPFSLTRKVSEKPKVAATNPFAQKKAPVISSVVDEVESDSDEGVGNFFSLDQVSEQKVLPKVGMEPYVVGDVAHSAPVTAPPHGSIVSHGESGSALVATTAASSATSGGEDSHANPIRIDDAKTTVYEASADSMDEPLKFGSGASTWSSRQYTQIHGGRQFGYGSQNAGQYMDHVSSQPIGQYKYTDQGSGPAYNDPYSSSVGTHGIQSNEQYTYSVQGGYDYNEVQSTSSVKQPGYSLEAGQSLSHLVQDEKFLKIQGVKQRGKEEINFIDVNADDELGHMDNHLIKGLSEETEHRSKRKKEEMPSAQQKRKHQLKYLAFQAKERELELKNAWAQGRANRKTAQSKYGF